jgi:hypothetical protein
MHTERTTRYDGDVHRRFVVVVHRQNVSGLRRVIDATVQFAKGDWFNLQHQITVGPLSPVTSDGATGGGGIGTG